MIDAVQFLMSLCLNTDADGKFKPIYLADTIREEIEIIERAIKHSQRWVGLTDEEIEPAAEQSDHYAAFHSGVRFATIRLKEKNHEDKNHE